jgi:hypothetical protein
MFHLKKSDSRCAGKGGQGRGAEREPKVTVTLRARHTVREKEKRISGADDKNALEFYLPARYRSEPAFASASRF